MLKLSHAVRDIIFRRTASLEVIPLQGSDQPAYKSELLDPLFSMDFASDSAQDILSASRRDSEEGTKMELKTETALHIHNSLQMPRKQVSSGQASTSRPNYALNVPQSDS